jgi:hypothetical protein
VNQGLILALLVGCSPAAIPMTPDHPANPEAPGGRLAGPPAALRRGVAEPTATPARSPSEPPAKGHEGHH